MNGLPTPTWKSPGQRAFEAYFTVAKGRSLVSGQDLPPWENLGENIQAAWEAAARAVLSGEIPPAPTET